VPELWSGNRDLRGDLNGYLGVEVVVVRAPIDSVLETLETDTPEQAVCRAGNPENPRRLQDLAKKPNSELITGPMRVLTSVDEESAICWHYDSANPTRESRIPPDREVTMVLAPRLSHDRQTLECEVNLLVEARCYDPAGPRTLINNQGLRLRELGSQQGVVRIGSSESWFSITKEGHDLAVVALVTLWFE
jgi:hypothetical protein